MIFYIKNKIKLNRNLIENLMDIEFLKFSLLFKILGFIVKLI